MILLPGQEKREAYQQSFWRAFLRPLNAAVLRARGQPLAVRTEGYGEEASMCSLSVRSCLLLATSQSRISFSTVLSLDRLVQNSLHPGSDAHIRGTGIVPDANQKIGG
jgi:hypothetical protein